MGVKYIDEWMNRDGKMMWVGIRVAGRAHKHTVRFRDYGDENMEKTTRETRVAPELLGRHLLFPFHNLHQHSTSKNSHPPPLHIPSAPP